MPINKAKDMYGDKFYPLLDEFYTNGRYVYSDPDIFVMAYPHVLDILLERNLNKTLDEIDVWVIHFFAGDMKRLFEIAPFELKWVAFERNEHRFRVYETEKLKRRIHYDRRITKSPAAPVPAADTNQSGCGSGK